MKLFVTGLLIASGIQGLAAEYGSESPQIIQKQYQAMHSIERDYEIGKSNLTLTAGCQLDEAAAKETLTKASKALQDAIEAEVSRLGLGESGKRWESSTDGEISVSQASPITQAFNADRKLYVWKNICTGEESDAPVRAKPVYTASKNLSVWFSNEGTLLNDLANLVTRLEDMSSPEADGAKVKCNSASGANYDLDVTPSTEKEIWAEIERTAKERAHEAKRADFAASQYNSSWFEREYFSKGGQTALPYPNVVRENGEWVAKFSSEKEFTIFYKQSSEASTEPAQLSGTKSYKVDAKAESREGLYGQLSIQVSQGCQASRSDAEQKVAEIGGEILEKLRELNKGQSTETDRLEVADAAGYEMNPLQTYRQYSGDRVVNYYYNPCTLETFEVTQMPEVKVWQGAQNLTIRSSDLNALEALQKELAKTYQNELSDPNQVTVSATWSATAKLSVLESFRNVLEARAVEAFQAPDSAFSCESGKFSFACLAKSPETVRPVHRARDFAFEAAPAAAYSEEAGGGVMDSERGKRVFRGVYTVEYSVRKVLKDHRR